MEGNGFKPEDTSVSTHIVESYMGADIGSELFNFGIERCYKRLSERAAKERSVIVNVVQNVTSIQGSTQTFAVVIITAQRISIADLERQQRAAHLRQGIR